MKRFLCLLLLFILLVMLSACSLLGAGGENDTGDGSQLPSSDAVALAAAAQKAEYYRGLVAQLEQEMLALKSDFRDERAVYEARIAALEAAFNTGNTDTPTVSPNSLPFTYTENEGKITVTGFRGGVCDLVIPQDIGGVPIVAIADRAFENAHTLRSVRISESVTSIGWFAFSGCISLVDVTIPAGVTVIRYGAFQNCPSSLVVHTTLGSYADAWAQSYGIGVEYS